MSRIRDIANILSGVSTDMATDAEVTSSIASHAAAADPHTGYVLESLFDAKGDLLVGTADNTLIRQAVGSNNQVLMADSAQTDGVKWANEATATLTTTGDLLYASAANSPARLGIGANGTYLTSDGSVPSWGTISAGGMTLIASGNTVNGASVITLSGIPTTYVDLVLYLKNVTPTAASAFNITLNNISTTHYSYSILRTDTTGIGNQLSGTTIQPQPTLSSGSARHNLYLHIRDYANTTSVKNFTVQYAQSTTGTCSFMHGVATATGHITAAITRIDVALSSYSGTGGTYALYGVK